MKYKVYFKNIKYTVISPLKKRELFLKYTT